MAAVVAFAALLLLFPGNGNGLRWQEAAGPSGPADATQGGEALFTSQVDLVVLYASVVDRNQQLVTGLPQEAFEVSEDRRRQPIAQFSNRDIPVSMGILVDSSASMENKRRSVNAAALALVRASNPEDEVFILNFRDTSELAQDYTSDIAALERGLSDVKMWGGTAVMDALHQALVHSQRGGKNKKVLLAITDGEDDSSRIELKHLLTELQKSEVTVYTIGILSEESSRSRRNAEKMLRAVAKASGGAAFFPESVEQVAAVASRIAHDIRNQYVIAYRAPDNARPGFHAIRVKAEARHRGKLTVRTRPGYFRE